MKSIGATLPSIIRSVQLGYDRDGHIVAALDNEEAGEAYRRDVHPSDEVIQGNLESYFLPGEPNFLLTDYKGTIPDGFSVRNVVAYVQPKGWTTHPTLFITQADTTKYLADHCPDKTSFTLIPLLTIDDTVS